MPLPHELGATLPPWLVAALPTLPTTLASDHERMRLVNELADRNWHAGNGGPFAAAVVDAATGEVVSVGVNVVLSSGLSGMHAEVVALGLAQVAVGGWDLGASRDLQLVVNWRPCAMCYGALIWSGVKHLLIAGDGPECEQLTGFDEGPVTAEWVAELEGRGISVSQDVGRDDAIAVFAAYGASNSTVYNARGTGSLRT